MSEIDRYGPTCDCMHKMSWGDYVLASDYDQLKAENERLKKIQSRQDKVAEHFKQFWQEIVDEPFTEWLNDDATHWICDEDAAFQAWQYLHQEKIWTMKEQTQLAIDERDTLRKQLDETNASLGSKNARIAEFAERHLSDFAELERLGKQLAEARELLDRTITQVGRTISDNLRANIDAFLEANK